MGSNVGKRSPRDKNLSSGLRNNIDFSNTYPLDSDLSSA